MILRNDVRNDAALERTEEEVAPLVELHGRR